MIHILFVYFFVFFDIFLYFSIFFVFFLYIYIFCIFSIFWYGIYIYAIEHSLPCILTGFIYKDIETRFLSILFHKCWDWNIQGKKLYNLHYKHGHIMNNYILVLSVLTKHIFTLKQNHLLRHLHFHPGNFEKHPLGKFPV